ncbi:MAG: M6 family metalloprotease domain-containing protein [Methanosarcinales archaeon]|nr:M6 family metalloprotease domain-containing protein [Methanosarcinales archaeon]
MSAIFGETLIFSQTDGPDVELVVNGDEFYARYETTDGYTVIYDQDLGRYCYAVLLEGRFASSSTPITKPPQLGIRRHLKESEKIRNEKFEKRYSMFRPPEPAIAPHILRTVGPNEGLLPGRRVSEGQVKGLTVLVEFDDISTDITTDEVNDMLNQENYSLNGNFCSVRDYYLLMSNGKLDYSNHVVGPVKLSKKQDYYTTKLFVQEVMDIVVNDLGIDLSKFDSKGEGIIDALNFMYAGHTVYTGDLWPHNSYINLNYGGIRTYFYMLTSLGRSKVDLSIGTFCHENGHQLCRFPDIYDYGRRDGDFEKSSGIGLYCLMGAGNHLNNGRTPSPVCAYLRYLVGWQDREVRLNSPGVYEAHYGDYSTIMKYETGKLNEFFLVENRSGLGLDSYLPDSGLAVYHCDILGSNEWQGGTPTRHYQCGLLQADGHLDLENNVNRGDVGDMFDEKTGIILSHDTVPSSREWDGSDSGLIISDITAPGERINFRTGSGIIPVVKGEVTADMLIPDYEPEGISSVITLEKTGRIKSINVSVDIIHTYIGDLQVELKAPSGKKAMLHNKKGGYQNDLCETYLPDSIPELADMIGDPVNGDWILYVRDLLKSDTGRLNKWKIKIEYESVDQVVTGETSPNLPIPDNDPQGLNSVINISKEGYIKDIKVSMEISHTYIGDLVVELVAPSSQSAVLHNRSGGNKQDLRISCDRYSSPSLHILTKEQIKGDWILRVKDLSSADKGTLEKWSLKLAY